MNRPCRDCGHLLRPAGTTREKYPGTYVHAAGFRCSSCYRAYKAGKKRRPVYKMCRECKHPMVTKRQTPVEDQVRHYGHGVCTRCAHAIRCGRDTTQWREVRNGVTPCPGCQQPTRNASTRATDHPGTTVRRKHGFCYRCLHDGTADEVLAMTAQVAAWRARSRTA